MSPIKDFSLVYEALNKDNIFSAGDTVAGTVSFTLTKEIKVKRFHVKVKGLARVHWSEGTGDRRRSHTDHRKYFKVNEHLIAENEKGTLLPQGAHRFNFKLKIPQGEFPSSFKGYHGKVVYMAEAKMSRRWKLPAVVQTELNFVSKSFPHSGQCPQSGSVGKGVGKGEVQMSATVDRKVCSPGDTLSVVAKISNSSSKDTKPKFSLRKKTVYRAHAHTNVSDQSLCKIVGDTIPANSEDTVSCQLKIPYDASPTVHNCDLISVKYYLKVYLDISFAFDPEVVLPLVIVPLSFATPQPGEAAGPYPAGASGAPGYSDFPPPAFPTGPYPVPPGPGAYGYPAPNPTQQPYATSGYNNPWPQQTAPYGFANAAYPPPLVQHQVPTAPAAFQQGEELPTYTSLFPPSQDTFGGSGSNK